MNRLAARRLGGGDHGRDPEVALGRRGRADADRAVGEPDVERVGVGGRVHRDGLEAELVHGPDHPDGDLAAVRYEDSRKHQSAGGATIGSSSKRSCPNSTGLPFSAWIAATRPAASALSSLKSFIASSRQSVCPGTTTEARKRWFAKYISTVTPANARSDTRSFLDFLARQSQVSSALIGTTGYCLGGGLSLSAAGNFPERVIAAASYHGGNLATDSPDSPHRLADRIKARVYVAGAVEDASFPEEQKQTLIAALSKAKVDHVVETYEGALHGWVPPDSAVHEPDAAERHWRTLLALYDAKLKQPRAAE